ncbi:MAG: NAD(P)/FAD-dependent oxidoreductase [Phycisphaerae bacterium]|nr:NAD(P)/FAD-dependent oxidoreductase [Phycisphaerae bacterium]
MTPTANQTFDAIILGGGPAGATCATILAQHGRRPLILEKATFPRHHIGESLMPGTYEIFDRLGILPRLKNSDFTVKESVQFVNSDGRDSRPYFFPDRDPHERSYTWQVKRSEFDQMMLDNARDHGAEVLMGAQARRVIFEGDRAVGVVAKVDGQERELRAKVIVDATGQGALLSRQLNIRYPDQKLRNAAIYSYYKGAHRDEGRNAGATLVVSTPNREGWFWVIPLADDITSIGVVAPPAYLTSGRGDDPEATLAEEIRNCPGVARRLANATRVDKVYVCSDFSYRSERVSGEGWVLIGDAFGFLDPVYSSGLLLAFKSGEWAADAIHDALKTGDLSATSLGRWGPRFANGMQLLRQLVYAFYDRDFSFAQFMKQHPEHGDHLVRLLIGDVFNDEVGAIFDPMRNWTKLPEAMAVTP